MEEIRGKGERAQKVTDRDEYRQNKGWDISFADPYHFASLYPANYLNPLLERNLHSAG